MAESAEDDKKRALNEFLSSLPRVCSPTVCGLLKKDDDPINNDDEDEDMELARNCSIIDFDQIDSNALDDHFEFNWSLEQIALLNPLDFSNEFDHHHFDEMINQKFDEENEQFFKQDIIAPSPATNLIRNESLLKSALDNSHMLSLLKTPSNESKQIIKSLRKKSTTPINSKMLSKKKLFDENRCDKRTPEISVEMVRDFHGDELMLEEGMSHISCTDLSIIENSRTHCEKASSFLNLTNGFDCLSPIVRADDLISITPPNHPDSFLLINKISRLSNHPTDSGCEYSESSLHNITSTPCCVKD